MCLVLPPLHCRILTLRLPIMWIQEQLCIKVLQDGPTAAALPCAGFAQSSCLVGHTNCLRFLWNLIFFSSSYCVDQTFLFQLCIKERPLMNYSFVKITIFHGIEFPYMRCTRLCYRTAWKYCMGYSNVLGIFLILSIWTQIKYPNALGSHTVGKRSKTHAMQLQKVCMANCGHKVLHFFLM